MTRSCEECFPVNGDSPKAAISSDDGPMDRSMVVMMDGGCWMSWMQQSQTVTIPMIEDDFEEGEQPHRRSAAFNSSPPVHVIT